MHSTYRLSFLVLLSLTACGERYPQATKEALTAFVKKHEYRTWKAERQTHPSKGPHGMVRIFVNDVLYASMKAGNTTHPNDSMAVKELYEASAVSGYTVNMKRSDGNWVFFEGFAPDFDNFFYVGTGNVCANCHLTGVDFVRLSPSALP